MIIRPLSSYQRNVLKLCLNFDQFMTYKLSHKPFFQRSDGVFLLFSHKPCGKSKYIVS